MRMTPEQLDEIEKRWDGYLEKNEVERRFLFDQWWDKRDFWDMTKALREAWGERDEALGDARLADTQLDEIVELSGSGGDGSAFGSVERLIYDLKERTEERDEAREEVERLLVAAAGLPRKHPSGLSRAAWFDLAIRVAWDSGLRWGDLVALRVDAVRPDGACTVVQSKTSRPTTFRLSAATLEALAATVAVCPRTLVCPWPASHETFNAQVRRLVARAGIRPGTWKWIRRGSGSDVEAQVDGAGHRHLGNTQSVFERSYGDQSIIGRRTPGPRELLVAALAARPRKDGGGVTFTETAAG